MALEYSIIDSFDKRYISNMVYKIKLFFKYVSALFKGDVNKQIYLKLKLRYRIISHEALALSLIRGFKKLNIPFAYNKITRNTKYVILLWVDKKDLKKIQCIKSKYTDVKFVTVPTACKYDYNYMQWHFAEFQFIDKALYASGWVLRIAKSKLSSKYWNKICVWPSGVDFTEQKNMEPKIFNRVILYIKGENDLECQIINALNKYAIQYSVVRYGQYKRNEYLDECLSSDMVIVCNTNKETQGLAIAEAWSKNKPTLCKTYNKCGHETAPYLRKKCGLFYKDIKDLNKILKFYKENPMVFLSQFSPYEYSKKYFSDEASVKSIIKIFNNL